MATFNRIAIVCLLTAATAAPSWAQKYKSVKPLPTSPTKAAMSKILKGEVPYSSKTADDYYRKALMAQLTLPPRRPGAAEDAPVRDGLALGQIKRTIMRDLETAGKRNPAVHASLVKDLIPWCAGFTNPKTNFPPVAQYNAMLIIGALNDKEASNSSLPVPAKKALPILYKGMTSTSDPVAVASLVGVLRHAEMHRLGAKMPEKIKQAFSRNAYKIVKAECPQSRSESGHEWMQRRALEILGAFGDPGKGNSLAKAMDEIIRDEEASVAKRCSAIAAVSRLKMSSAEDINKTGNTTVGLATTTAVVCRQVSNRLAVRWNERENSGGYSGGGGGYGGGGYGGGGGGYGGYGGGGGGGDGGGYGGGGGGYGGYGGGGGGYGGYGGGREEEEEPKVKEDELLTEARRDLKYRLGCVNKGVKLFTKFAPDDRKLEELGDQIEAILKSADQDELKASEFVKSVAGLADALDSEFGIDTDDDETSLDLDVKPAAAPPKGNQDA